MENIGELKAQLKTLEQDSKALSKQIGLAKKNQDPAADQLIAQKKALHADKIDPLKAQIKERQKGTQASQTPKEVEISAPASYLDSEDGHSQAFSFEEHTLTSAFNTEEWNNYVSQHPMGNLYYQTVFLNSIAKSLGHPILLFILRSSETGKITAALPIIEQKSFLFGHLWTSIALVNYGGVLANNAEAESQLLEQVKQAAIKSEIKRLEIRGLYKRPVEWPVSTEKASMWLPLPESNSAEDLLNSFKAKLRSQIKKGYTPEVTAKTGGVELLDDYYTVFARNMRDLGTPVYGRILFESLLKDLGSRARLVIVYHNGKPASAAFLIRNHDMMEIPWASTIRDFNRFNLNMVLYWEVLKYTCEQQCRIFDFGRSSIDASTYKFKKQWGAQPIQHYWYGFENEQTAGEPSTEANKGSNVSTSNPKMQLLISIWQKLPLWLANLMGPHIVKYIP